MRAKSSDLWSEARGLLIPFQGCVGQVVILKFPQSEMERVLQTFVSKVKDAQIFDMAGFAPNEPIEPSAGILQVIANDVQNIAQIEGFLPTADYLKLMIEPDEEWGGWLNWCSGRASFFQVRMMTRIARGGMGCWWIWRKHCARTTSNCGVYYWANRWKSRGQNWNLLIAWSGDQEMVEG